MKRILLTLVAILSAMSFYAQTAEFVKGQLLVQTINSNDGLIDKLLNDLSIINNKETNLKLVRKISPVLDIYLLEFNYQEFSHEEMLRNVGLHSSILIAQNNHVIEYRSTTPNDPSFGSQWQYINPGGNGGVAGADIDADLAWDVTTGGVTPFGDTIVVCVVDDGFRTQHPDFEDNLWFNRLEIPNNGIDDDGNGFIDDARGWNADNNNDDIVGGTSFGAITFPGGGHGTPVAGIVGAKGNNGVGVAGVNWDVKLMIVVGGGNEAQTIAAYAYPLQMRKLYNSTNGEKGAFVVAVNSSWGTDFGQPSEAPLWCAMYDTMGKYGILNAGATINGNQNVDVVGDLPTGCPSDYLISVTNIGRNDIKVTEAGYGRNSIDIGAFGEGTWTVSGNNSYGAFGGTSGATPHVAGAIALLYSAPCESLADLYVSDPAQAALNVKQYILEGGDNNASLQNITITGKRLNLFGALTKLDEDCFNCPKVAFSGVNNITPNSAQLAFTLDRSGDVLNYTILYRPVGSNVWQESTSDINILSLNSLTPNTLYEYLIVVNCAEGTLASPVKNFNTIGVSVNNLAVHNGIAVYPNPAKDVLSIKYNSNTSGFEAMLFDITGKLIQKHNFIGQTANMTLTGLNSGVYILRLKDDKGNLVTQKIEKY